MFLNVRHVTKITVEYSSDDILNIFTFHIDFWIKWIRCFQFILMGFRHFHCVIIGSIFMNINFVSLQILALRKWFSTSIAFEIFVAFMNCSIVFLQITRRRKWFTTRFTFVIFVPFMNCADVYLQMIWPWKWFTTRFTFVFFVASMKCVNVPL